MVNKPFWHISDLVLASYTFGCVKMSDFVPNNLHLREVLIFFFHEAHKVLQSDSTQTIDHIQKCFRQKFQCSRRPSYWTTLFFYRWRRWSYFKVSSTFLTLSGAHFSVKLILAINGNLGVFGVADHDSDIRIAKLKMADPRWRLCESNVEFFENFAQNTLSGGFWSRRLQIWCQNCKFQNSG